MSSSPQRPQRLLRISRACDFCHKRRIKCQDNQGGGNRCRNCTEFNIPCTYARPLRRGRSSPQLVRPLLTSGSGSSGGGGGGGGGSETKASIATGGTPLPAPPTSARFSHRDYAQDSSTDDGLASSERLSPAWQGFARSSTPTLKRLFVVYQETVYPIFPYFDAARLERRLTAFEHVHNRAFFCSVMAGAALAAARARDGACPSSSTSGGSGASSGGPPTDMPPEIFFAAAEEALPQDIMRCQDFDYLRSYALLTLASIQDAKMATMHKYMGHYFTMLAMNQWHDEANWSPGLDPIEVEERRRVYWSIYTLDVYASIIWDGCIHFQESHAKVEYPTGRTEQDAEDPYTQAMPAGAAHWMVGWNYTTDLYRILEHNLSKLRSRSSKFNLLGEPTTPGSFRVSSQDRVTELYSALPAIFKQMQPATGEPARDIYGFQAANIQATMSLLEMVHLSLEVDVGLEQKCTVVHNVLQTFHQVPTTYLRAISAPLIYHIGGIGGILGSVMESPLSESACRLVRDLLLSMAGLLESLEALLHRSAGAGQRLRHLAARLEEYISLRKGNEQGGGGGHRNSSISSVSGESVQSNVHAGASQQQQSQQSQQQQQQQPLLSSLAPGPLSQSSVSPTGGPMTAAPMTTGTATQSPVHAAAVQTVQSVQAVQSDQNANAQNIQNAAAAAVTRGPTAYSSGSLIPPPGSVETGPGGSGWDSTAAAAAGAALPDMALPFQLREELLQDWTWPFAVSNNYLSF